MSEEEIETRHGDHGSTGLRQGEVENIARKVAQEISDRTVGSISKLLQPVTESQKQLNTMMLESRKDRESIHDQIGALEEQRRKDHEDNRRQRLKEAVRQQKAERMMRREIRALRMSQRPLRRRLVRIYEWCTEKDDEGNLSRKRIFGFATMAVGAVEAVRHYGPVLFRKASEIMQAIFR